MRCYYICFFDSLLSTCPKKMETEKWPKAADSPLPKNVQIPLILITFSSQFMSRSWYW